MTVGDKEIDRDRYETKVASAKENDLMFFKGSLTEFSIFNFRSHS